MSALRSSFAFLGTCALAGVEPLAYVREVLIKLQGGWPAACIDELLPAHAPLCGEPADGLPGVGREE